MSEKIKLLVMEGQSALQIREAALAEGMVLMKDCGLEKVFDGVTTPEEVMRVVYVEED